MLLTTESDNKSTTNRIIVLMSLYPISYSSSSDSVDDVSKCRQCFHVNF